MKFFRKHRLFSIVVIIVISLYLLISITFGRYIKNIINNFLLETKGFYFNSSILKINGKNYSVNNWDGVSSYMLTIDLNNRKNSERYTKTDISYDIYIDCPSTVYCFLNKKKGVISSKASTDTYQITVTPKKSFEEGQSVNISTSVVSSKPYVKTMSANYTIGVETSDFSYEVEDNVNDKFFLIRFTNSVSFYEVQESFGSYNVGDNISIDDYKLLSSEDKDKCYSAIVTVEFDPSKVFLDMTSNAYIKRLSDNYKEVTIGGYKWVSKFSFKIDANSSSTILFYKDDITKNYTYPIVNDTSIIDVSVKLAN